MYSPVGHKNISRVVEKNKEWNIKYNRDGYLILHYSLHDFKDLIVLPKYRLVSFINEKGESHDSIIKFKESEFVFDWNSYNILFKGDGTFWVNYYYDDYKTKGFTWDPKVRKGKKYWKGDIFLID